MERYFKVSEGELLELLACMGKMIALENGGVDNWDWYGVSLCEALADLYDQFKREGKEVPEDVSHFYFSDVAKLELENYEEIKE